MSEKNDAEFTSNTDDILAELKAEGNEVEGAVVETPKTPEVLSQTEPEEPEKEEEPETPKEVVEDTEPIDRAPKEPTLIPAWKAKIAEDRHKKEIEALQQQIEQSKQAPTQENAKTTMENVRELAQTYGLELDEAQEQFFNALVSNVKQNAVPQDLVKNLEALQQQKQIDHLETQYSQEFNRDVAPLIKERYGDLPDKELATLQKKLHDIAFTETYAKVPLKKIFLAESEDLNIRIPKEAILTNKGGKTRGTELDLSNVDEETFSSLDGDSLDKFIEQKSGQSQWSRR